MNLLAYIGKARTKFEQKFSNMPDQFPFDFPFLSFFLPRKGNQKCTDLSDLVSHIRLRTGNGP